MTTAAREHAQQSAARLRDRCVVFPPTAADTTGTRNATTGDYLRFRRIHVHDRAHARSHSDRDRQWRRVKATT